MVLETVLMGAAASAVGGLTKDAALAALKFLTQKRPDVVRRVEGAATPDDLRRELVGAIEIAAADGRVAISGVFVQALRSAMFDHQHGVVQIGGTTIQAPVLTTGGGKGATGKTIIEGGTVLRSNGTEVQIGRGASIVITGGASMKQT